jgi:hypothetical protein
MGTTQKATQKQHSKRFQQYAGSMLFVGIIGIVQVLTLWREHSLVSFAFVALSAGAMGGYVAGLISMARDGQTSKVYVFVRRYLLAAYLIVLFVIDTLTE